MSVKHTCLEEPAGKEKAGTDLFSVLALGHDFLAENGLGLWVCNFCCCKRVVGMVRAGLVPIPKAIVSLAGKDSTFARQINDFLRRPKHVRQALVVHGLHMRFDRMADCYGVALACERLVRAQWQNIERFEHRPSAHSGFEPPRGLRKVKQATVLNPLRATTGVFLCIGDMAELEELTYEGPVVWHATDRKIAGLQRTLPHGAESLVAHLPDTLVRLAFEGDCFALHEFRFGYALRDRVRAGGFPVLREVRLGSLFFSLIKLDAVETLRALQGVASLRVLELGTERSEWGGGWWNVGMLARAVQRFRTARADVEVLSVVEELRAESPSSP
jgi:hypothetical protein